MEVDLCRSLDPTERTRQSHCNVVYQAILLINLVVAMCGLRLGESHHKGSALPLTSSYDTISVPSRSCSFMSFHCLYHYTYKMFLDVSSSLALVLTILPFVSAAPVNNASSIVYASGIASVSGYRNAAYFPNWCISVNSQLKTVQLSYLQGYLRT